MLWSRNILETWEKDNSEKTNTGNMAHKRKEMKNRLATLLLNSEIPDFILSSKLIGGDGSDESAVIRPDNIIPARFRRKGGLAFSVLAHAV